MSAVAIMRALLQAHTPLLALVPANKIFAGKIPQETPLPAVSIEEIDGFEQPTIARLQATTQQRRRVQVTVCALSYPSQKAIHKACALGPGTHRGTYAGFKALSVQPAGTGPDLNDLNDDGIYEQSRDFMVTFAEAS